MNSIRLKIILGLILSTSLSLTGYGQEFTADEDGVLLSDKGQKIFYYQAKTKSLNGTYPRANYLHPLYGLDGQILTEDFPADHLHHRGIFWAWHQLYAEGERLGDAWACDGISWEMEDLKHKAKSGKARIKVSLYWVGELKGQQQRIVKEETTITYYSTGLDYREIDFEISLTALKEGVKIGGSEDVKGYSGFSARLKLPEDLSFQADKGEVQPVNTAVKAGGWMDISGTFNEESGKTGVTMICDMNTPIPFHGWILRNKGSMQNAAFPGREPVDLEKGKKIILRYKLIIHPDGNYKDIIEQKYQEFNMN